MADANVLKNAQNVDPARSKYRETEGAGGIFAKLALAGVIVQAFVAAKSILFGEKATAEQASSAPPSDAAEEPAAGSPLVDAMEVALDSSEPPPSEQGSGGEGGPRALGSGAPLNRQFGSAEVAIPHSADHVSSDNRAKAASNDNVPVPGVLSTGPFNLRLAGDLPSNAAAGQPAIAGAQALPREAVAALPGSALANRAPEVRSPLRLGSTFTGQALVIAAADLLRHASDADADPLSIGKVVAGPGATLREVDGAWIVSPNAGFNGHVEIAFSVSDGKLFSIGRTVIEVLDYAPSVIDGTAGSESIAGTPKADMIRGGGGSDDIIGREGADVIQGGDGRDRIAGGDGDDVIRGSGGNDILLGQSGNDVIFGGEGDDVVEGGDGNDALFGEDGADRLLGQSGNDVLDGGKGADSLEGGDGNDTFVAQAGDGNDVIDGSSGEDTLDLSATNSPALVDLAAGTSTSAETGSDTIAEIENVVGSAGNDIIRGDDAGNAVTGGQGSDIIEAMGGDDVLIATVADGNDEFDGGEGTDTYDASLTSEGIIVDLEAGLAKGAEIGQDRIVSIENVSGGDGNDVITADEIVNVLLGGAGDDVFVFRSTASAGSGRGNRDVILDFEPGDKIDLRDISREFDHQFGDVMDDAGINKFTIIAAGEEFARPGQVRFAYEEAGGKTTTIVQGNTDYDTSAEFEIELAGRVELQDQHLVKSANPINTFL